MSKYRITKHRGKWAVRVGSRRFSTGFDAVAEHRGDAERAASEIVASLSKSTTKSVSDMMDAYLSDKASTSVDVERLRNAWKRLEPFFGKLTDNQITREACREYIRQRSEKVSPGTINKELQTLRAGIRWNNPATAAIFEMLPAPEPRDRWLTREEFKSLLDACGSPHLELFLRIAIATGARKSAILELTWLQINWDSNQIWFGRKANGKKRARVPMSQSLRFALEEASRGALTDYVIEYNGAPVKNVRTAFERAVERAGLSDLTIHDIRHTAACWLAMDGHSMSEIAQYLGHSNSLVTERIYARYSPEHLTRLATSLEI